MTKQRNEKLNDKVEPRSKQTKEIEEMKKWRNEKGEQTAYLHVPCKGLNTKNLRISDRDKTPMQWPSLSTITRRWT